MGRHSEAVANGGGSALQDDRSITTVERCEPPRSGARAIRAEDGRTAPLASRSATRSAGNEPPGTERYRTKPIPEESMGIRLGQARGVSPFDHKGRNGRSPWADHLGSATFFTTYRSALAGG